MTKAPILTVMKDGEVIKTCPIEGDVVLGRGQECNIWLNDRAISRHHAVFKVTAGSIQVEKKSEFGALSVNGAECTQSILKESDIVSIGPYLIRLSIPAAPAASNSAPPSTQNGVNSTPQPGAESPQVQPQAPLDSFENSQNQNNDPVGEQQQEVQNEFQQNENDPFNAVDSGQNLEMESSPGDSASGNNLGPELSLEPIDEDGKTKITSMGQVSVKLIFAPGTANYTEYEFTKDEISIGRGQDCDIILADKKASRKNSIIRKAGLSFIIKDLDSANGTILNGVKIQEQELTGDDVIKIGGVEFQFKALSSDYLAKAQDFISLPAEAEGDEFAVDSGGALEGMDPNLPLDPAASGMEGLAGVPGADGSADLAGQDPAQAGQLNLAVTGINETSGIPGITGINGSSSQKKDLLTKFKALPRRTQIIVSITAIVFVIWVFSEDEQAPTKKGPKSGPSPKATVAVKLDNSLKTFDSLSPEQKRFVENQHLQAFDHYKNRNYEAALYEIQKIFELIPDYKDSRELERYAKEGKQRTDAKKAEDERKALEEKHKKRIAQLLEDAKNLMDAKKYDQARELFTQIIAEDPENTAVTAWRKEIEAHDDEQRIQAQQKQVQQEINKRAWDVYQEGMDQKNQKKLHSAINTFQSALDVGASDTNLIKLAKKMMAQCYSMIRHQRDPVLNLAKKMEKEGNFSKAFNLYKKATKIDPPHPAGYAGMNRIRGILHDKAKAIYTDAILAESFSDFAKAKQLFEECLKIAPVDDIYHDRAERKLSVYYMQKEEQPPQ